MSVQNVRGGDSQVTNVMLGDQEVSRMYKGTDLIWERGAARETFAGIIAMFDTTSLPTGWVACDGQNATPDLRDRFIVCAGDAYSTGATGGANAVTLTVAELGTHSHNASANNADIANHTHTSNSTDAANSHNHSFAVDITGHSHEFTASGNMANFASGTNILGVTQNTVRATNNSTEAAHSAVTSGGTAAHTHSTNNSGNHAHNANSNSAGSTGSHENRPPYYAMVYAMATVDALVADGMIVSTETTVPEGWAECNGTAAQPNLRDLFIVGAGTSYAVGATGGLATVALTSTTMPSHSHSVYIYDGGDHGHTMNNAGNSHTHQANLSAHSAHSHNYDAVNNLNRNVTGNTGTAFRAGGTTNNTYAARSNAHTVDWLSSTDTHSHTGSDSQGVHNHSWVGGSTGSGTAHENRPQYRAVRFIRKVGAGDSIPSGVVVPFHGDTIPDGWELAWQNGGADYRNRMLVGAGTTYAVGAIGGQDAVSLTAANLPSHNHNGNLASAGSHSHSLTSTSNTHTHSGYANHDYDHTHGGVIQSNTSSAKTAGTAVAAMTSVATKFTAAHNHSHTATKATYSDPHTHTLVAAGDHSHSVYIYDEGTSSAHENRPPYYALPFIRKI